MFGDGRVNLYVQYAVFMYYDCHTMIMIGLKIKDFFFHTSLWVSKDVPSLNDIRCTDSYIEANHWILFGDGRMVDTGILV